MGDALTETTPEGEQVLMPGVVPITSRDRLLARIAAPMTPKRNPDAVQMPCDIGLFDQAAREQIDLIDFLCAIDPGVPIPDQSKKD